MKKIALFLLTITFSLFFSQFNTAVHIPKKPKKETADIKQQEKENLKKESKPEKKVSSKKQIQKQLDSIKLMLQDYQKMTTKKASKYEQIKDSLIALTMQQTQQNVISNKTINFAVIKQFNHIKEEPMVVTKISMPLNRFSIVSNYGKRVHPIFGSIKMHNGVDLVASYENVYAVMDGIVTEAGWDNGGGGNYIKIKHSAGYETSYLHLSKMYYKPGEYVNAGFIIAQSGNTGNSTGPHLHFAVKQYNSYINPTKFLNNLITANNLLAKHYEYRTTTN